MSSVAEDHFRRLVQITAGKDTGYIVNAHEYLCGSVSSEIDSRSEFAYDVYDMPQGSLINGSANFGEYFIFGSRSDIYALRDLLDVVTALDEIQALCLLQNLEEVFVSEQENDLSKRCAEIYLKMQKTKFVP